jgi:predicted DNA-binding WGR domain protein
MQTTHHLEAAELVKIVPAKKQARFYRLAIWPDLFGGFSLAREYGRIGQGGRLCLTPFPCQEAWYYHAHLPVPVTEKSVCGS